MSAPCDLAGCGQPWAWQTERRDGAPLRMCEGHATLWQMAEADLLAEVEEMAGRGGPPYSDLFGLARSLDGRMRKAG